MNGKYIIAVVQCTSIVLYNGFENNNYTYNN